MKRFLKYFFLTATTGASLAGCEKVIDPELDNADPKVVIEANLSDQSEAQVVRISKSVPSQDSSGFNPVSGAVVVLQGPGGSRVTFPQVAPGIYRSARFRGVPGSSYTLNVTAEGTTYSATSRMPEPVKLDSLTFTRLTIFGSSNTYPVANYTDPGDRDNQYRYILKVNSMPVLDAVTEDRFNNGNEVADVIFYELEDLATNDRIDLELQSIDRNVFKYFFALQQIRGDGGPPVAPANPVSNFNNGALGFFSAHTSSRYGVFVKLRE
ncbi:MAG TPA: DUF4249 domain-containing protein [Sphingobacteriaceae bacterium]